MNTNFFFFKNTHFFIISTKQNSDFVALLVTLNKVCGAVKLGGRGLS